MGAGIFFFGYVTRARFVALFMVAVPLASVIGGLVSGFLLGIHGALGLKGWQWLFIVKGLPACVLAFAVLALLPDSPERAAWLSKEEAALIVSRRAQDDASAYRVQRALWPALTDRRVLLLGVAYLDIVIGVYGVGFWMPQIVKANGIQQYRGRLHRRRSIHGERSGDGSVAPAERRA